MTVEDLASAIAHHMGWSPHVGSYSEQIAEFLLAEYPVLLSAEPVAEQADERAPVSDEDPGETAAWPA